MEQSSELQNLARGVVEQYGSEILGYLVRTMRSETDAAEVFSQFCEDLCRGIPNFEGRSSVRTWAYRLATNARARFWRDPYRRFGQRLGTDEMTRLEQQIRTATLPHLRTDVKDRFAGLRDRLTVEEQTLLTLRVDKDLGWTEIAEVLATQDEPASLDALKLEATVLRQRFKRLKAKIRRMALDEGLIEDAGSAGGD